MAKQKETTEVVTKNKVSGVVHLQRFAKGVAFAITIMAASYGIRKFMENTDERLALGFTGVVVLALCYIILLPVKD